MLDPIAEALDPTRLLFDLHRGSEIAQGFSGCLDPEAIADQITQGLVEKFDCAFARIWLLEPEQTFLKLVASAGMYTHTNGSFARVPMGAYKVGKIAQNRVSFLSNNLAAEPWVGDREWAIAKNIRGFAGYPLVIKGRVIGVLATFSHHPLAAEFLEVLQTLCTLATIALDAALQHQSEKQSWQSAAHYPSFNHYALSDQLASILTSARLTLVGTEQPLRLPLAHIFLQATDRLNQIRCAYCRLIYTAESVALESLVAIPHPTVEPEDWIQSALGELLMPVAGLGGVLQTQTSIDQKSIQVLLKIPYPGMPSGRCLRIQCRSSVLQMAFTHLSFLAGLTVYNALDETVPLLTDDASDPAVQPVLQIRLGAQAIRKDIYARIDLSISPPQLREAVEAVSRGESWGIKPENEGMPLSERELEMMTLLSQGLRDRDIANQLIISESTVKFHINNILAKLKARTRYQALHQVIVKGWIQ
jgi:DNA-binding CsgD family transcriptional regulator